ncbi:MAG: tRNA 2-thiouridine(34) synthase MnmA [Verrucomicrobia bacterium]|nr:tRNA 2-thiouridine(34) synthase MnmA [Verrucomicrobiota bacterium]
MSTSPSTPRRVAVGMSGGIDSSVAAVLLVEQGWEVIGFTLHMVKEGSRCCSLEDVLRARKVCDRLGIRHYTLNVVDSFEQKIIRPFAEAYAAGKTPNPCVFCNREFKFGEMLARARALGCTHLATGHYVRLEQTPKGALLRRGHDPAKDQSYFLHRLTQDQLQSCIFPIGDLVKAEVRRIAAEKNVPTAGMRETNDLCFITAAGPAPLIEKYHPHIRQPGPIVDESGKRLGTHDGLHHFTVGQRGGIRIAAPHRLYVSEIRPETNTIVIGKREAAMSESCKLLDVYWQAGHPPPKGAKITARLRYQHPGVETTLILDDSGNGRAIFAEPQFAVTPGQAAVFYEGDLLLGGAWIGIDRP